MWTKTAEAAFKFSLSVTVLLLVGQGRTENPTQELAMGPDEAGTGCIKSPWVGSHTPRTAPRRVCCCSVTKSCLTVCNPMECSPPGPSVYGILENTGENTEVGCHFLLQGTLLTQGSNPCLLLSGWSQVLQADALSWATGEAQGWQSWLLSTTLSSHHQPIRRMSTSWPGPLQCSPLISTLNTLPWKPAGSWGLLSINCLFSLLDPVINTMSVDWLYCDLQRWTEFSSITSYISQNPKISICISAF